MLWEELCTITQNPKNKQWSARAVEVSLLITTVRRTLVQHFETEASFKQWASLPASPYSDFGDILMGKNRKHGYED